VPTGASRLELVFDSVRADVGTAKLGTFDSTPQYVSQSGSEFALFVAPTKKTATPFDNAASAVLSDIQSLNSTAANSEEESILEATEVGVNPRSVAGARRRRPRVRRSSRQPTVLD